MLSSGFRDGESVAMIMKGTDISIYGVTPLSLGSTHRNGWFSGRTLCPGTRVTFTNIFTSTSHVDYSVSVVVDPFVRGKFNGWLEIETVGGTQI